MKASKYVVISEMAANSLNLEKIGDGLCRLNEVYGEIIHSETCPTNYGSCLELEIEGCKEKIWWQQQKNIPLPALAGQVLRGFYEDKTNLNKTICLKAYELLNEQGEVLTRASESKKYRFMERD